MIVEEKKICSICGKVFVGFGNNASPINDGICCDNCNSTVVIPERIRAIINQLRAVSSSLNSLNNSCNSAKMTLRSNTLIDDRPYRQADTVNFIWLWMNKIRKF